MWLAFRDVFRFGRDCANRAQISFVVVGKTNERPTMSKVMGSAMVMVVLTLVLVGCSDSGSEPTTTRGDVATTDSDSGANGEITIQGFAFSGTRSVPAGSTVVATNQDGVTHTWTSVDEVWNSGGLSTGDSFEFTFTDPGEYDYFCSIHPQMTGSITVEG